MYTFTARSTGEPATSPSIPFLSQRYAVRAAQLIAPGDNVPARNVGSYDQWVRNIVDHLDDRASTPTASTSSSPT